MAVQAATTIEATIEEGTTEVVATTVAVQAATTIEEGTTEMVATTVAAVTTNSEPEEASRSF